MNQKEDDFAHLWIVAKRGQNGQFWLSLAIRHPQVQSKPDTKKEAAKVEQASYSRIMSIADAVKAGETYVEKIILNADRLYTKKTGRDSNQKETRTNFAFVRSTLLALGFAVEADGNLKLKA